MQVVPFYDEYFDGEEVVSTSSLIGYRVMSQSGAVLGEGETREEALEAAMDVILPLAMV